MPDFNIIFFNLHSSDTLPKKKDSMPKSLAGRQGEDFRAIKARSFKGSGLPFVQLCSLPHSPIPFSSLILELPKSSSTQGWGSNELRTAVQRKTKLSRDRTHDDYSSCLTNTRLIVHVLCYPLMTCTIPAALLSVMPDTAGDSHLKIHRERGRGQQTRIRTVTTVGIRESHLVCLRKRNQERQALSFRQALQDFFSVVFITPPRFITITKILIEHFVHWIAGH